MRTRRKHLTVIGALALAGAVAACSDDRSSDVGSASTVEASVSASSVEQAGAASTVAVPETTAPGTEPPAAEVPPALDFRAPLVGGGEFDGATFAGRPVAFWFWAPT